MVLCTTCNFKWKARHIWTVNLTLNGKACENCGMKQYVREKEEVAYTDFLYYMDFIPLVSFIFSPLHVRLIEQRNEEE